MASPITNLSIADPDSPELALDNWQESSRSSEPQITHDSDKAAFESVFRSTARVQGLTHDFYRYPARFSPQFVRFILDNLSEPGDCVLDPFMGGGTTIVESLASGRRVIGTDLNELSQFVTRVKTTPLSQNDVADVLAWVEEVKRVAADVEAVATQVPHAVRNLPVATYSLLDAAIRLTDGLSLARRCRFARCALLGVGQWALDSRMTTPGNVEIADHLEHRVRAMVKGADELVSEARDYGVSKAKITGQRQLLPYSAANPLLSRVLRYRGISPKLILTSPPYPGVHMLYHRWQIHGRRETPAPYWIADLRDGHGEGYYTMGGRSTIGLANYFRTLEAAFRNLLTVVSPETTVVQLVAFSRTETQLPLYRDAMANAGFEETAVGPIRTGQERAVPNRKWYNQGAGPTDASTEVLLVHRPRG